MSVWQGGRAVKGVRLRFDNPLIRKGMGSNPILVNFFF